MGMCTHWAKVGTRLTPAGIAITLPFITFQLTFSYFSVFIVNLTFMRPIFSEGFPTRTQEAKVLTQHMSLSLSPQEKKSMLQPSKDPSSSATICPWTRFKAAVTKSHCRSKPSRGTDWCCTRANRLITSTWHWKMGLSHSSLIWGLEPLKLLWSQSMGNLMTMIGMMSK